MKVEIRVPEGMPGPRTGDMKLAAFAILSVLYRPDGHRAVTHWLVRRREFLLSAAFLMGSF